METQSQEVVADKHSKDQTIYLQVHTQDNLISVHLLQLSFTFNFNMFQNYDVRNVFCKVTKQKLKRYVLYISTQY